ncbi:hypothetical protein FACS18949_07840 [Clostridia bacterium]|nr:hypothetical protein FACS18949_07840 [Clostridia bacterium]
MKNDDRGLSLVELIISIAILAILSTILVGFISSGGGLYRSVSASVSLQMKSQTALAQIREYTVDAHTSTSITDMGTGLNIDNGTHVFTREDDKVMYKYNGGASVELASDVQEFFVKYADGFGERALEITLTLAKMGKTYTSTQVVALRNKI